MKTERTKLHGFFLSGALAKEAKVYLEKEVMQMFGLGRSQIGGPRIHPQPPLFGTWVELVDEGRLHESESQALNLQERSRNHAKKH